MSISNLTEGLNEILRQKNEYITPENIKKNVQIFNITGSYEGINTSDANATASDILKDKTAYVNGQKIIGTLNIAAPAGDIKLFNTIEEMNASTGNEEGDIGVVYNRIVNNIKNIEENDTLNAGLLLTTSIPDDETLSTSFSAMYMYDAYEHTGEYGPSYRVHFDLTPGETFKISLYYDNYPESEAINNEIIYYYETYDFDTGEPLNVPIYKLSEYTTPFDNDAFSFNMTTKVLTIKTDNPIEKYESYQPLINKFVQLMTDEAIGNFNGIFRYNGSNYYLAETQLNATSSKVYDSIYYGPNGIEEGTLFNNLASTIDDFNAEVIRDQLMKYAELSIQNIDNVNQFKNVYTINSYFIPSGYDGKALINTTNMTSMSNMFNGYSYITNIPEICTNNVTNMSNMFAECTNLRYLPEHINTSNVTNMALFVLNCNNLIEIPNNWDVSNVEDISFDGASSLVSLPNWNLSKLNVFNRTFRNCFNLVDASNIVFPEIINGANNINKQLRSMFQNCYNLINFPNITLNNTPIYAGAFNGCHSLQNLDFITTDTPYIKVNYGTGMFQNCYNLTHVGDFEIFALGVGMFRNCYNLTSVGNITFTYNYNGANGDLTHSEMFKNCYNLASIGNIVLCDNSFNVTYMFANCKKLTTVNIFNMEPVQIMHYMFTDCLNLTDINITNINNTINAGFMFNNCRKLVNVTLTGKASNCKNVTGMFSNCNNLTNNSVINIIKWIVNIDSTNMPNYAKNLLVNNWYSPFYNTKFKNSYYSSYVTTLKGQGWIC